MQAKKRYLLVLGSVAFLALCYFGGHRLKSDIKTKWREKLHRSHFVNHLPTVMTIPPVDYLLDNSKCRMETCFNFTKCSGGKPFKVFVYPDDERLTATDNYIKILDRLRQSNYYTSNPDEACLFVLSLDTLDRDSLSTPGFVRNLPARLAQFQSYWNGGTNHLVFNLYSGTYPDYAEIALGFDVGRAILAKASMSDEFYRPGFDVSLPLFGKSHPAKGSDALKEVSNGFPVLRKHTLAFKGKRYVYGIGSETRNSLYHLHNGRDMVLVTTCRHGKSWEELKDERCDEDNEEFDR
jgi:glucuronyl/N-acetylglucosaminyl transferase EXT1